MSELILGVDLSRWQLKVRSYAKLKTCGCMFAFIKATEGPNTVDLQVNNHHVGCKEAGILYGFYHFARKGSIEKQAKLFFDTVPDKTAPVVVDLEDVSMTQTEARDLTKEIERLFVKKPIIYTGKGAWAGMEGDGSWARPYTLWVANYPPNLVGLSCTDPILDLVKGTAGFPKLPTDWTDYTFWQFTRKAKAPTFGIDDGKELDLNVFKGTQQALEKFFSEGITPPPSTLPPVYKNTSGGLLAVRDKPSNTSNVLGNLGPGDTRYMVQLVEAEGFVWGAHTTVNIWTKIRKIGGSIFMQPV